MHNDHPVSVAQAANTIKQYITQEFLYDRSDVVLTNDFQLIEQGVIDSMGIFRLITYLEATFNRQFDLTEIEYHNFATIDAITALLTKKAPA